MSNQPEVDLALALKTAEDNLSFWTSCNYKDHEEKYIREQTEWWKAVVDAFRAQVAANIKADTITSSRFTPEEREAMEILIKTTVGRGMDTQTYDALLTVRAMLQEAGE